MFFVKIFQKVLKISFLAFFQKFARGAQSLGQYRVFIVIDESSENQFGRPKKISRKISIFFENPIFFIKLHFDPVRKIVEQ